MKFRVSTLLLSILLLMGCKGEVSFIDTPAQELCCGGGGGSVSVSISLPQDWTAGCDEDWISLGKSSGSAGKVDFRFSVGENRLDEGRIGTVWFTNGENCLYKLVVNQDRHPYLFYVSKLNFNLSPKESSIVLDVVADENVSWKISNVPPGFVFDRLSGNGPSKVGVTLSPNATAMPLYSYFTVSTDAYVGADYELGHNVYDISVCQESGFKSYEWILAEGVFVHNSDDKVDAGSCVAGYPAITWNFTRLSYGHCPPSATDGSCGIQLLRAADLTDVTFTTDGIKGRIASVTIEAGGGQNPSVIPVLTVGGVTREFDRLQASYPNVFVNSVDDVNAEGTLSIYFPKPTATIILKRITIYYFEE